MLLRTRIIIALTTALIIIAAIMLVQNFVSREQIQKAIISEVSLGQNVIWKKILESSHKQNKRDNKVFHILKALPNFWNWSTKNINFFPQYFY